MRVNATPTQPAPSLEQYANEVADRCEAIARRSIGRGDAHLAIAVAELAAVVRELATRSLPR